VVVAQGVLGLPELDRELAAALPTGWLALAIGHSDSDTSLFAKQFAHAGAESLPSAYYTTYERTEDVRKTFQALGWAPESVRVANLSEEYYQRVLVRHLEVSRIREKGLKLADLTTAPSSVAEPRPYSLPSRILSDLSELDQPFRLVLDSLDFLLEVLDLPEVLSVSRQIRHRAQQLGGQALLVVHGEIHERRVAGLLEDMADVVVELETRPDGARFEHRIVVRKVRNHPEMRRTCVLRMTEGGLKVELARGG
jgi:KaiC/GvpD/RAD55 family RecA-like ATPase